MTERPFHIEWPEAICLVALVVVFYALVKVLVA